MTNLVRRYYLTRKLVAYCNLRDRILEKFRCVDTQPDWFRHKRYILKCCLSDFFKWCKRLAATIKYLELQLAEAGGGFR